MKRKVLVPYGANTVISSTGSNTLTPPTPNAHYIMFQALAGSAARVTYSLYQNATTSVGLADNDTTPIPNLVEVKDKIYIYNPASCSVNYQWFEYYEFP